MAACEQCWTAAFDLSRSTGRSQAEVYLELVTKNPVHTGEPCPRCGSTNTRINHVTENPIWRAGPASRNLNRRPDRRCRVRTRLSIRSSLGLTAARAHRSLFLHRGIRGFSRSTSRCSRVSTR